MPLSYNKLWKLLIDRGISKQQLIREIGISPNTMTRLNKNKSVSMNVLMKICEYLEVNIGEIVDYIKEDM